MEKHESEIMSDDQMLRDTHDAVLRMEGTLKNVAEVQKEHHEVLFGEQGLRMLTGLAVQSLSNMQKTCEDRHQSEKAQREATSAAAKVVSDAASAAHAVISAAITAQQAERDKSQTGSKILVGSLSGIIVASFVGLVAFCLRVFKVIG